MTAVTPRPAFTQEMFDRYPLTLEVANGRWDDPAPEFLSVVTEDAKLLLDRPMFMDSPSPECLRRWGLECYEQYSMYDLYCSY